MNTERSERLAGEDGGRSRRILEAMDVAAVTGQAGVAASAEEQRVLLRIAQQRRRLARREEQRVQARALRSVQARAVGEQGSGDSLRTLVQDNPLYASGRDFVLRHPLLVGFALGSSLVLGPRRLLRVVVWAAPLAWRGWRVAERVGLPGRRRR